MKFLIVKSSTLKYKELKKELTRKYGHHNFSYDVVVTNNDLLNEKKDDDLNYIYRLPNESFDFNSIPNELLNKIRNNNYSTVYLLYNDIYKTGYDNIDDFRKIIPETRSILTDTSGREITSSLTSINLIRFFRSFFVLTKRIQTSFLNPKKILNSIKNIPILHYLSFIEYIFEPHLKRLESLKLYGKNFWLDRYLEVKDYYNISHFKFIKICIKQGFPNSNRFALNREIGKKYFHTDDKHFSPSPDQLLKGYQKRHFGSNLRFMLGYHRHDIAEKYMNIMEKEKLTLNQISVLDYGCAVADPALYLGAQGANITIVDLSGKILEFAEWRFKKREIPYTCYSAQQTEKPVKIEKDSFDFIIMSEFLEHVRHPILFLQLAIDKLQPGGIFYDPIGTHHTKHIGGDHLIEAKEEIDSEEYHNLHTNNFDRIKGHFYRKVNT